MFSPDPPGRLKQNFCKMEIRLILLKEIGFGISLNNQPKSLCVRHLLFQKQKSRRRFFLQKVSLTSILQNST
jgi:hypothetical protein